MNKKPKNIEQLYSESFSNFRVEPSSGLWKSISSKLAWRNFFSFNPTAFNVYYVAGLLTIATAGVLLLTKPAIEINQKTKEITINNERRKAEGGRQKEEGNIQKPLTSIKPEGKEQKQDSSIKNTTTQHPKPSTQQPASSTEVLTKEDSSSEVSSTAEASAKAVTKEDNPKLITPNPELVTRIVSRSEAKVDNPKLVTPDPELATPHPTPKTQNPPSTKHQAPSNQNPEPWPINDTMDSLFVSYNSTAPEYKIEFPNAFTPNTNGPTNGYYTPGLPNNDVFHPEHKGVTEYHLEIYNRRGELIFECNDINIGWDGYINSRLAAQGVYVWKACGKYSNGQNFIKAGNVILIKK